MLIDHKKSGLWLPCGGHIEPQEHPRATVVREADEEVRVRASFDTPFGDDPLFVTVTRTIGHGQHTDVSLWYIIAGKRKERLQFDRREMKGYKWLGLDEILAADIRQLDPCMHRFIGKMQQELGKQALT